MHDQNSWVRLRDLWGQFKQDSDTGKTNFVFQNKQTTAIVIRMLPCVWPGSITEGQWRVEVSCSNAERKLDQFIHWLWAPWRWWQFFCALFCGREHTVWCRTPEKTLWITIICGLNKKIHNVGPSFRSHNEYTLFCPLTLSVRTTSGLGSNFHQKKWVYLSWSMFSNFSWGLLIPLDARILELHHLPRVHTTLAGELAEDEVGLGRKSPD